MKFIFRVIIIALIPVLLVSCDKDLLDLDLPTMTAEVDGVAWSSLLRVSVLENGVFSITGTSLDGNVISLLITGESEGTYQLSVIPLITEFGASYLNETNIEGAYVATSGEVILTKVDTVNSIVSGEFHFMAANATSTISITNGEFDNLNYTGSLDGI